jgi:PAS domain-containing protein
MPITMLHPGGPVNLRERAQSRLPPPVGLDGTRASATGALRVLHDLASSPATAADALALLHELQVHQVELDLQAEELRDASADLEVALARQVQLFNAAPAAYLVVDQATRMLELNATGAQQLGGTRAGLLGQHLGRLLAPPSRATLQDLLASVRLGNTSPSAALVLQVPGQALRCVAASASLDPAGTDFLLILCPMPEPSSVQP